MTVEPWPEADAMFRRDPRWLGGDDAYSIPLGDHRHLWLFGDTLVQRGPGDDRRTAHFVNNTVAIQTGDDPATADITFHWRGTGERPTSIFEDAEPGVHLWPGDGVMVDGKLLLFFMRVGQGVDALPQDDEGVDGIQIAGWSAAVIDAPQTDPSTWEPRWLPLLDVEFAEMVGSGGVFIDDDHIHGHAHPIAEHRVGDGAGSFLARWPLADLLAGDITPVTWLLDDAWVPTDEIDTTPTVVITPPLTEFTIHAENGHWIATQLLELGEGNLALRTAPHPTGPWSDAVEVHRSPLVLEDSDDVIAYAGKSHPDIGDRDGHLITYASNTRTLGTIYDRTDLYYPHCLRRSRPTTKDTP